MLAGTPTIPTVERRHWMETLQAVFYPTLAIVGIPSNIITFLIIWRKNCRLSRSSTFYLMAISVADTLVLIFIVVLEVTIEYHQREPFWNHDPWCSLRDIFNYGAYNSSTWLVVVFTVERFISISTWRIKAKVCNPRCAMVSIITVFLVSHACAIPHYWSNASVYENQTGWVCVYKQEAPLLFVHTLVWAQTVQAYMLPFVIILTLNGLTLRQISLSNKVHIAADVASKVSKATSSLRSKKRKSMLLLVTVSMTFVMLSLTRAITQIILRTTKYSIDRDDYSRPINVAADIGTMLSLSNAAANMYLYVCTQTKFRKEFIACVKRACWR